MSDVAHGPLVFFLDSFITLVYIWQFKRREKQLSYIPTPLDPLMQTTCACIHDVYDGKREENKCPFHWWSATELSGVMMRIRYRIIYIILVCLLCYACSRIFHSNEDCRCKDCKIKSLYTEPTAFWAARGYLKFMYYYAGPRFLRSLPPIFSALLR